MRFLLSLCGSVLIASSLKAAPVVLIDGEKARVAIHVQPEIMEAKGPGPKATRAELDAEKHRVRVRESVKDLAIYLEKLSGKSVAIHQRPPVANDQTIPVLIGAYADAVVGPFKMKTDYQQAYRLVVSPKSFAMQGETGEGVSYAIYELLDALGCRWFIPGELGEVIPTLKTVSLEERDLQSVPGTVSRHIWYADDAFKRRNRMGGFAYSAGHALEGYVAKDQLEKNQSWNAEMGGKRTLHRCDVGYRLCWANPEVPLAVADRIITNLDKNPVPCVSIGPGDGIDFCECAACKKLDAGDWDPSMSCVAITDRFIHFANQIATKVATKHPDVKLGFLAYVQFTRPPVREKLHANLIPQLAPITYCRAHTIDDPACESRQRLRHILEGWGKVTKQIAMYEYYFHLAEVAAPFPAIKRNLTELPIQYGNNITMWTPETLPNFESITPGLHLGMRMSWHTKANPETMLQEFFTNFYGSAGKAMGDYWTYIDDCWTTVPEHAGCGFSYMRRFTPDRMAEARKRMDTALAACKTDMESRRVKLADDSLKQHELFMKIRRDYFGGKYDDLGSDCQQWISTNQTLAEKYKDNFAFTKTGWAPQTINVSYFNAFYNNSYKDLVRINQEYKVLTPPLLTWNIQVDKKKQGSDLGWQKVDVKDSDWPKTNVSIDTWSALGLESYYGPVWYRKTIDIAAIPPGKKVYLWVGATDGGCKVFINGKSVTYTNKKGAQSPEANGFCEPFSFDITDTVASNASNQITIQATRNFLNELGTGGLLGPVLVYREK